MYLHFFNSFLVFMIVGLVGEAVVIAEVFRLLIPPLFLSPDNSIRANIQRYGMGLGVKSQLQVYRVQQARYRICRTHRTYGTSNQSYLPLNEASTNQTQDLVFQV